MSTIEHLPSTQIESIRQLFWSNDHMLSEAIRNKEGFQAYFNALAENNPDGAHAVRVNDHRCGCVDERVETSNRLLGSGVMESEAEQSAFYKENQVTHINWHPGCAAAGMAYRKEHGLAPDAPVDQSIIDDYAEMTVKGIAERNNLIFDGAVAPGDEYWHGDENHHFTTTLYLARGAFNPFKLKGLPQGFVVSIEETDHLNKAHILSQVACGKGGFGDLINQDNPFKIILVGDSAEEITHMREKAELTFTEDIYHIDSLVLPRITTQAA